VHSFWLSQFQNKRNIPFSHSLEQVVCVLHAGVEKQDDRHLLLAEAKKGTPELMSASCPSAPSLGRADWGHEGRRAWCSRQSGRRHRACTRRRRPVGRVKQWQPHVVESWSLTCEPWEAPGMCVCGRRAGRAPCTYLCALLRFTSSALDSPPPTPDPRGQKIEEAGRRPDLAGEGRRRLGFPLGTGSGGSKRERRRRREMGGSGSGRGREARPQRGGRRGWVAGWRHGASQREKGGGRG
jgi:hypothetical protein